MADICCSRLRHLGDHICAADVDRLTFGGHIIETGIPAYRLAATLAQPAG